MPSSMARTAVRSEVTKRLGPKFVTGWGFSAKSQKSPSRKEREQGGASAEVRKRRVSLHAYFAADFRRRHVLIRAFLANFEASLAAEESFLRKLEDRVAVFRYHFQPRQSSQHGEIDAAEADARQEDVDAVTERLVVE